MWRVPGGRDDTGRGAGAEDDDEGANDGGTNALAWLAREGY